MIVVLSSCCEEKSGSRDTLTLASGDDMFQIFSYEKFYGARRFYEPLKSSDSMVKKEEEPVMKN